MYRPTSSLGAGILVWCAACQGPPAGTATPDARAVDAAPVDAGSDASNDAGPPDLTLDPGRTAVDLSLGQENVPADSCMLAADEACVGASGLRDLLRFTVETPNVGESALVLGIPRADNPNFLWSECHQHFHFQGYASYELLDDRSQVVVTGRKQAFCLVDSERYSQEENVASTARYHCGDQGLQAGWTDVYLSDLPCQFLDVTGIGSGDYTLRITVNPDGLLEDARSDNNVITVPVALADPTLATPTEDCSPAAEPRAVQRLSRECGWQPSTTFACTPGLEYRIGCSAACGLGSCTGNPMLRICDGNTANCTMGAALASNDDRCGTGCPTASDIICPDSGSLDVYVAGHDPDEGFSCDPELAAAPTFP